jgi:serine O-acetyltransferase
MSDSSAGRLAPIIDQLVASYRSDPRTEHLDATFLPSRARAITIIELLRRITFPGFFDEQRVCEDNLRECVIDRLSALDRELYEEIRQALRYQLNRNHDGKGDQCNDCDRRARELTDAFLARIPAVRELLATDVQATFDGDPASVHTDEAIFCYPGLDAVFTYRYAHELYRLDIPMLPRIMTEAAHNDTGIDIHPGATIGPRFFIDHGTGIVIGETTIIGANVKIYQGVTLGALSLKGGHNRWQGSKRHPTIEDDVTIYGGAIILGGETVIGKGATIGGTVFLTRSVPPGYTVTLDAPVLRYRPPTEPGIAENSSFDPSI